MQISRDAVYMVGQRWLAPLVVVSAYVNFMSAQGVSIFSAAQVVSLLVVTAAIWGLNFLALKRAALFRLWLAAILVMFLDTHLNLAQQMFGLLNALGLNAAVGLGSALAAIGLALAVAYAVLTWAETVVVLFLTVFFAFLVTSGMVMSATAKLGNQDSAGVIARTLQVDPDRALASRPARISRVIHIIFDAHGSLQIKEWDDELSTRVKKDAAGILLKYGFEVFLNSHSTHFQTHDSIPALLNFTVAEKHKQFFRADNPQAIARISVFEEANRIGLPVSVHQITWIDFCSAEAVVYASCRVYTSQSVLRQLDKAPGVFSKVPTNLLIFSRSFPTLANAVRVYNEILRAIAFRRFAVKLPHIPSPGAPRVPMALAAIEDLTDSVIADARAGKSAYYFAHVLMPHSPFSVYEDCRQDPNLGKWPGSTSPRVMATGAENDQQSISIARPAYFRQLGCLYNRIGNMLETLEVNGLLADSLIIFHGDHGSRISFNWPSLNVDHANIVEDDFENFGTHFALHRPLAAQGAQGAQGQISDQAISIQAIFAALWEMPLQAPADSAGKVWLRTTRVSLPGVPLAERSYLGRDQGPNRNTRQPD